MTVPNIGPPVPDLGGERDDVVIEGKTYTVAQPVVNEIIELRRGLTHEFLQRIRKLEPGDNETVVVVTPESVSPDFVRMAGDVIRAAFPTAHGIVILPESLNLHTQEGLKQLILAGNLMRAAFERAVKGKEETEDVEALDAWKEATGGGREAAE